MKSKTKKYIPLYKRYSSRELALIQQSVWKDVYHDNHVLNYSGCEPDENHEIELALETIYDWTKLGEEPDPTDEEKEIIKYIQSNKYTEENATKRNALYYHWMRVNEYDDKNEVIGHRAKLELMKSKKKKR